MEIITRAPDQDTDRPHLVFIPGAFHGAWCWDEYYLPWFAEQGWQCHGLSLRGHEKDAPKTGMANWSLQDYTADVCDFLDQLPGSAILIGHSMGGVISQMCFAQSDRVAGLVPFASSPLRPALRVIVRMLMKKPVAMLKAQIKKDPDLLRGAMQSFFFSPDLDQATLDNYIEQLTSESQTALDEVFSRSAPVPGENEQRPVLVIAGRDDWSIPLADHQWLASIYKAKLEVCAGSHDIMLDPNWLDAATVIDKWLQKEFGPS